MVLRAAGALVLAGLVSATAGCTADRSTAHSVSSSPAPSASSSSTPSSATISPMEESLAQRCSSDGTSGAARPFVVRSRTGASLYAVVSGHGPHTVVLVHGSGTRGLCNWEAEIPWLADAGLRVVAYDAMCVGNSTCTGGPERPVADLVSVVDAARNRGAREVVVVAASAGGPLAILAAARPDAGVAATVALSPAGISADAGAPGMPRIARAARTARVPVLYVLARDDTSASLRAVRALHDSGVDGGARLRILPRGAGHAQETLYTVTMEPSRFRTDLLDFLASHTR